MGGAQENLRIEFCAVVRRMPNAIDMAGVGTGDGFRVSIEERGPDGRSPEVEGKDDWFGRAARHKLK